MALADWCGGVEGLGEAWKETAWRMENLIKQGYSDDEESDASSAVDDGLEATEALVDSLHEGDDRTQIEYGNRLFNAYSFVDNADSMEDALKQIEGLYYVIEDIYEEYCD